MQFDFRAHLGTVNACCFSNDGRNLATSGSDYRVGLWDLRTSRNLLEIDLPIMHVSKLQFSPKNDQLIGSTHEGYVIRIRAPVTQYDRLDPRMYLRLDAPAATPPSQLLATIAPSLPVGEPPRTENIADLLTKWASVSVRRGTMLRPTFDNRESDEGVLLGAIRLFDAERLYVAYFSTNDPKEWRILCREADIYAQTHGEGAAFPGYFSSRVAEIIMLSKGSFDRQDVPSSELPDVDTPTILCREIHRWAKRQGYVGGFPTFAEKQVDGQMCYPAVLIKPSFGHEIFVPSSAVFIPSPY